LIGENKKTSKDINRYEKKIKYLEKEVSVKESVNEHIRRIYKRDLNKELKTEGKLSVAKSPTEDEKMTEEENLLKTTWNF